MPEKALPTLPSFTRKAELEWLLVLSTRRGWTALSVAVLALAGWLVVGRAGSPGSPPGWGLALLSVGSGLVWLRTQQLIFRVRRLLCRPVRWSELLGI